MCYRMLSSNPLLKQPNSDFLYSGDEIKEGTKFNIGLNLPWMKEHCLRLFTKHRLNTADPLIGYMSSEVSIQGHTYKPGAVILLVI